MGVSAQITLAVLGCLEAFLGSQYGIVPEKARVLCAGLAGAVQNRCVRTVGLTDRDKGSEPIAHNVGGGLQRPFGPCPQRCQAPVGQAIEPDELGVPQVWSELTCSRLFVSFLPKRLSNRDSH